MIQLSSLFKISRLAMIVLFAITTITLFKEAVELEDAEQAYYSQWFRLGYDDQPPLYTWVQNSMVSLLGTHKSGFSFLRGVFFSGVLLMLYGFAKERKLGLDTSKMAVVVLVFVPVFIDLTFRRLSHTTLLCFSVLASYYAIQRLLNNKTIVNYLLLGLVMGFGVLSKYNYIFFLMTFFMVSVWDKTLRKAIWQPKIGLSIMLCLLMVFPHTYWLLENENYQHLLQQSVQEKMKTGEVSDTVGFLMPFVGFSTAILSILFPLMLGVAVLFLKKQLRFKKIKNNWFFKMAIVQIVVLSVFFIALQTQKIETRWLLPLFLPFVVLLVEMLRVKNLQKKVAVIFVIFYGVVGVQFVRTPIEKALGISSSVHFGFHPLEQKLRTHYLEYEWMLPNVTYAGNIKLLHPSKKIYASDDYSLDIKHISPEKWINVSFSLPKEASNFAVDSLIGFGKEKENLYFYKGLGD